MPGFNVQDPHDGKGKSTPKSCFLTSTRQLWHTHKAYCTHSHTHKLINVIFFFKSDTSTTIHFSWLLTKHWADAGPPAGRAGSPQKQAHCRNPPELPEQTSEDLSSCHPAPSTCTSSGSSFPLLSQQIHYS